MSKKYYIKQEDFHKEYEKSLIIDKPTNKLLDMFLLIAENYSSKFNNCCELDKNSCINYAAMEAYSKWKEYDKKRSENIFAFFTQMIKDDLTISYNNINKNSHRNISIDVLFENKNKN